MKTHQGSHLSVTVFLVFRSVDQKSVIQGWPVQHTYRDWKYSPNLQYNAVVSRSLDKVRSHKSHDITIWLTWKRVLYCPVYSKKCLPCILHSLLPYSTSTYCSTSGVSIVYVCHILGLDLYPQISPMLYSMFHSIWG